MSDHLSGAEWTKAKAKFYGALSADRGLSAAAVAVAWLLLDNINRSPTNARYGCSWLGIDKLSKLTDRSRRTIIYAVKALEDREWFLVDKGGKGRADSNIYRPILDQSFRVQSVAPLQADAVRVQPAALRVQSDDVKGAIQRPLRVQSVAPEPLDLTSKEPSEEPLEGARASRRGVDAASLARLTTTDRTGFKTTRASEAPYLAASEGARHGTETSPKASAPTAAPRRRATPEEELAADVRNVVEIHECHERVAEIYCERLTFLEKTYGRGAAMAAARRTIPFGCRKGDGAVMQMVYEIEMAISDCARKALAARVMARCVPEIMAAAGQRSAA